MKHVGLQFAGLEELMLAWCRVIDLARRLPSGMEFSYPHQALFRGIEHALTEVQAGDGSAGGRGLVRGQDERSRGRDEIRSAICQR